MWAIIHGLACYMGLGHHHVIGWCREPIGAFRNDDSSDGGRCICVCCSADYFYSCAALDADLRCSQGAQVMTDTDFKLQLIALESHINQAIDRNIELRDKAKFTVLKNNYRRSCRRLENALGYVHKAQELMGVGK